MNPFDLPSRVVARALGDLATLSRVATGVPAWLSSLEERADVVQGQLDEALRLGEELVAIARGLRELGERIDDRAEAVLALGERIDVRGEAIVGLGERIDARGESIVELGERLDRRGGQILVLGERLDDRGAQLDERGGLIAERAKQVSDRAEEVVAMLPTLDRALAMAEPLEGAVERLGRLIDRLPGAQRRRVDAP